MLVVASLSFVAAPRVVAETSSSTNYKVTETEFGSNSSSEACSGTYCSQVSLGGMAAGRSGTATFGTITPDQPALEVIVEPGTSYLGVLTPQQTATKTMVVKVRSYLSDGYLLQIAGSPLRYSGHTMATTGSPAASAPGTEQFGINAVANTTPNVGANLVQVPSGDFAYGQIEPNYATPNQFMYQDGATVARSLTASGQTDYTISMIINISDKTPAGRYASDFSAVVVPMY